VTRLAIVRQYVIGERVQTARLTRRESTELTRRRLIDGAIEILRQEGVAAATTDVHRQVWAGDR